MRPRRDEMDLVTQIANILLYDIDCPSQNEIRDAFGRAILCVTETRAVNLPILHDELVRNFNRRQAESLEAK